MTQITVSAEIARAIAQSPLPIVLVDPQGRKLGQMTRVDSASVVEATNTDDEWTEAKRRMEQAKREGGTFFTTKEVLEHLKSLER